MHTYKKALALSRSYGSQWSEVDLHDKIVHSIFSNYTKVYLTLFNSVLNKDVFFDLNSIQREFASYQDTLEDLLVTLGNRTLEYVDQLPSTDIKFVKYADAVRSQYKVDLTNAGQIYPDRYPKIEFKDLVITRPNYDTDLSLLHTHCLTTVNGMIHKTLTDGEKTYVLNGATTMRKAKNNHLGFLSFHDIGRLEKIDLNKNNIKPLDTNSALRDKIIFTIDQDIENKCFFMSLGGYLLFPEQNVFWRSGEKTFTLDLNQIPYVQRIFESNLYIDLSQLGLTPIPVNTEGYNVQELYSDRVIKEYLTLSQSFLVVVDVPHLTYNKIELRHSSLPGMFTSYQDPNYPLIVNHGKVAEYWKTYEDGFWSVNVQDSFYRNYVITAQPLKSREVVTDQLLAPKPFFHSRGYLLEIAGYRNL